MLERIGRYQILSTVGAGGMSTVYRGRLVGPAHAAKEVALKVIHPHHSEDRDFVLMFLDEMRLTMPLAHRNIVQTFDAGKSEETYFLVMELVEGLSLRELLDLLGATERMPLDLALFVASEVSAALEYAHNFQPAGQPAGVIHRDVSPGNILLSAHGDVKLTDFGVAKVAGRLAVSMAHLVMGKLSYMAPEQARGDADARADIFSLGAVLYEMLCGAQIRPGEDVHEVLQAPRLDPTRLARLPGVSALLRELVLACLEMRRELRPQTAGELQRRLTDELYRLPRNPRLAADARSRLQSYMALAFQRHPQQVQASEKTAALAQILLAELRALEPLPSAVGATEALPAAEVAPTLPRPRRSGRSRGRPRWRRLRVVLARLPRPERWRPVLPWAGVALGLLAGVALSAMIIGRDHPAAGKDSGPAATRVERPAPPRASASRVTLAQPPDARPAPSPTVAWPSPPRSSSGTRSRASGGRASRVVLASEPRGAEIFEGSRRLGKTPLALSSSKARTLGIYAQGFEPREVKIAAGAENKLTVHLKRSVLASDVTSLRQLKALRDSGRISEHSYRRRRAELVSQKLVQLKVQRKTGQISEEQYQRLVESLKAGEE